MKKFVFNFLLITLIEAASAVVTYLKDRLMGKMRRSSDDDNSSNRPKFV